MKLLVNEIQILRKTFWGYLIVFVISNSQNALEPTFDTVWGTRSV